jgi:hypothetical protein
MMTQPILDEVKEAKPPEMLCFGGQEGFVPVMSVTIYRLLVFGSQPDLFGKRPVVLRYAKGQLPHKPEEDY